MDRVCTRKLSEERGVKNFCTCINCKEIEQALMAEWALEFYTRDLCNGDISHYDPDLIYTDMGKKL